jgi:signal transduction histidine kinase
MTASMAIGRESRLAELLIRKKSEIVRRFVDDARETGASNALPDETIVDSLGDYVEELANAVRSDWSARPNTAAADTVAASHAEQRFQHGYDIASLVREYAALQEILCDVLMKDGTDIPFAEVRALFKHVTDGIAKAASKYAALRDAELRRRTADHIAFLAHELRNPLSSALMATTLVRARGEVKESRAFNALERGLSKATQLIDDALVSVRSAEVNHLDCTTLDLGTLLREIVVESEEEAAAKDVRMDVEVSGDVAISADPKVLRSALSNLIRNAVKFSRAGGGICVRTRHTRSRVIIEVEDSCGGLPPGAEQKLFDPYVQAGTDRSGFGLGLAIAKQAAEAHSGELRLHNLPGKGCVFVLDLPPTEPGR